MTLFFFVVAGAATLAGLAYLIHAMVRRSAEIGGLQLLTSSIAVWVTNVLMFSLLYWQIDRGGPEARLNNASTKPDWLFPQVGAGEDVPPDWRPMFLDYLFLGFTTATAFSPTADVSRQDADDARKHDFPRDDRRRRITHDQHPRQLKGK
jgi:hypothetical protein